MSDIKQKILADWNVGRRSDCADKKIPVRKKYGNNKLLENYEDASKDRKDLNISDDDLENGDSSSITANNQSSVEFREEELIKDLSNLKCSFTQLFHAFGINNSLTGSCSQNAPKKNINAIHNKNNNTNRTHDLMKMKNRTHVMTQKENRRQSKQPKNCNRDIITDNRVHRTSHKQIETPNLLEMVNENRIISHKENGKHYVSHTEYGAQQSSLIPKEKRAHNITYSENCVNMPLKENRIENISQIKIGTCNIIQLENEIDNMIPKKNGITVEHNIEIATEIPDNHLIQKRVVTNSVSERDSGTYNITQVENGEYYNVFQIDNGINTINKIDHEIQNIAQNENRAHSIILNRNLPRNVMEMENIHDNSTPCKNITDNTTQNQNSFYNVTQSVGEIENGICTERKALGFYDSNPINSRKDKEFINKAKQNIDKWIAIGSGETKIPNSKYKKIKWTSYSKATRSLLLAAFPRSILATHSLTGKRSPAFQNKMAKMCLDRKIVEDIILEVTRRFNVKSNLIRNIITTKCADESKMSKLREMKQNKIKHKLKTERIVKPVPENN